MTATPHRLDALTAPCGLTLEPSDPRAELAEARREARHWRLMFRAAMDALALVATVPERYEQIQRELRKDREPFMAAELARPIGPHERARLAQRSDIFGWTPSHEAGED